MTCPLAAVATERIGGLGTERRGSAPPAFTHHDDGVQVPVDVVGFDPNELARSDAGVQETVG